MFPLAAINSLLPISNPGFQGVISSPLLTVDTSKSVNSLQISLSATQKLWLIVFNFGAHPLVSIAGLYVTSLSYTKMTGADTKLSVTSSSQYNNNIGVTLSGGTVGATYNLVAAATLNNSEVISATLNISILS